MSAVEPVEPQHTDTAGSPGTPLFTAYGDNSPFAEAYRSLRVSLFSGNGASPRLLGMTGAAPRHGSSTTAANFGLIMGETGTQVVLVDADLYRPSLHRFFNLPNTVGLSSVLAGDVRLSDALQPITPPSRLKLLAGGPATQNPAALMRPERMKSIFDELRSQAELVVVDLPSVSSVAYTSQLATMLDGIVLVLLAGAEPSDVDRLVRRRLKGSQLVGIVLNRVPLRGSDATPYRHYADLK